MGNIGIRMGPLMLLLAVISICVSTLAILAIATANADLRIAGQYADMVKIRYALETEGQAFLCEAGEAARSGTDLSLLPDTKIDENGVILKEIWKNDYRLTAGIRLKEDGTFTVVCWKIGKLWEAEAGIGDLWNGQ